MSLMRPVRVACMSRAITVNYHYPHRRNEMQLAPSLEALKQQSEYSTTIYESRFHGWIFVDEKFRKSRILATANDPNIAFDSYVVEINSSNPITGLRFGFFDECSNVDLQKVSIPVAPQEDKLLQLGAGSSHQSEIIDHLLASERRYMTLATKYDSMAEEVRRLTSSGSGSGQGGWFDIPRVEHSWPLATNGHLGGDPYDVRCDDPVLLTGRDGQAFFEQFNLAGSDPKFQSAIEYLNNKAESVEFVEAPDVSIVIPIYGQLAYTLNCFDSLLLHESRYSFEIIVIDDCSPDESALYLAQLRNIIFHRQTKNGGFINSCNTGGELAKGKFILMLNNDTRVVPGWLDALIETFELKPLAGLVGSKMLYADGTLQEAGGIIWRDGSAWNYGRNDDPNRPQYCYAREVDYISGCSLVLPKLLWDELGGFDRHYTPAYCEDADLCLKVADRGYQVWFQPQSRLIHYEGKTSGTDTKVGVKSYQVRNTKKLYVRWQERLLHHRRNAEYPYAERERKVIKRALLVDATAPTPNQDAGSLQTVLGIRVFQACGYKVHFVPEDNWLFQRPYITDLQEEGVDCAYAPYELGFEGYIRRYGWMFDVVLVYRVTVLSRINDLIRAHAPQAVLLFHLADLHYLRMNRQATIEGDESGLQLAAEMKSMELDLVNQADCTITHSEHERDILAAECPNASVSVWPLMMDVAGTTTPFDKRTDIVFLGGYRHSPNIDGVLFFVREILPLVREHLPDVKFVIAGAHPPREITDLASSNIVVTGMVEDLRDIFDTSRVFVCPLRIGAGAKGKVMSALSYGVPIVSTMIGVEGAGLEGDEHVLLADTPVSFAEQCSSSIQRGKIVAKAFDYWPSSYPQQFLHKDGGTRAGSDCETGSCAENGI